MASPEDSLNVLVAPDSFKGTLSARQAAEAMTRGIARACPACTVTELPVADGGEGTAEALSAATGGMLLKAPAPDPLGRIRIAQLARLGDGSTFAVDAAAASGLTLLEAEERRALESSSSGTGVLMGKAAQMGARRIIVGVGGTGFVDGGKGLMEVLGVRFLDSEGASLDPGGGSLSRLHTVDISGLYPGWSQVEIVVATDVDNPLTGEHGAARVYGPQKGASPEDVEVLERGLEQLAKVVEELTGKPLRDVSGMGAGGGLSLPLVAFMGARIRPGAEVVAEAVKLEEHLERCDLVIVGEGCLDGQTVYGKAPAHVARCAQAKGKAVLAVAGRIGPGVEKISELGIQRYRAVSQDQVPASSSDAATLLEEGTFLLMQDYLGS
jgi:glycerate kinase